ncbi:replication-associated recombination protein A [Candidatus Pacearchaeota archaeon]|nr:replication-associated recombination protein A [Candidatus Pacearchaeota archaeon]
MPKENQPLAYRMRPSNLNEFVGQEHLVGEGKPLRIAIKQKNLPGSIIFWGPPGCGKTTLAKLISRLTESEFVEMSAVSAGKEDVKKTISRARLFHKKTILFLDEIHRFNKAQQDFLLPYVEDGTILLIGATTENPSFEVISALLSRSRVYVLNRLTEENLIEIIKNTLTSEKGFSKRVFVNEEDKKLIAQLANGDARSALNILEIANSLSREGGLINKEIISEAAQKSFLHYDKDGEEHYNIISALHKSMRDSDVDASIYWTMRMIEGGEDPKYIIRRMIRFASEDIGNADPMALQVATAAKEAVEFLGYPECDNALVQTAIYLAKAKKSNAVYRAVESSREDIRRTGNLLVPLHLRNAPTQLMKDLGYGKGYKYAPNSTEEEIKKQKRMPDELDGRKYYEEENEKM